MNGIWTKEMSFPAVTAEANFIAADLAVDKDGNVIVLAEREVRETLGKPAGYYPNDLFFLDKDGNSFRPEGSGFTHSPDNELMLAANKEDFYLLNGVNENGAQPSVIRFSKDDAIQGAPELGIDLVPTHTPHGRRMAQLSDGRLLIVGKDLTTRISNAETLQTTESNSYVRNSLF